MADFEKHLDEIFLRVLFSPTFENPDHKHEDPFACWIKTDFFGPELPTSSRVIDPISTAWLLLYSFASQLSLVAFSSNLPLHLSISRPPFFTWHLLTYQTPFMLSNTTFSCSYQKFLWWLSVLLLASHKYKREMWFLCYFLSDVRMSGPSSVF